MGSDSMEFVTMQGIFLHNTAQTQDRVHLGAYAWRILQNHADNFKDESCPRSFLFLLY